MMSNGPIQADYVAPTSSANQFCRLESFLDAKSKGYLSYKGTIHEHENFHPCNQPYIRQPHQLFQDFINLAFPQMNLG